MIRARENVVGAYAFLIGLIVSLIVGIFTGLWHLAVTPAILGVLALLGIVVGLFVAEKDIQTFLLASVSLVLVSYTGISGLLLGASFSGFEIGKMIASILQALLSLFIPATIVVAVKSVFSIAKS